MRNCRKNGWVCALILIIGLASCLPSFSQDTDNKCIIDGIFSITDSSDSRDGVHELSLFLFPTLLPLDWTSPSSLYKSMKKCYLRAIKYPDIYLLGHVAVGIRSPLLDKPISVGMRSGSLEQKLDLLLNQQVGCAVLGAILDGERESEKDICQRANAYAKREVFSFITFRLNEESMKRALVFLKGFFNENRLGYVSGDYYAGTCWPLYEGEGAGCSAFAIAMLEAAGIIPVKHSDWLVSLRIPMNLIGGEYNSGRKVRVRTIRRTHTWYEGEGVPNTDYADYFVHDPSLIHRWIVQHHTNPPDGYRPVNAKMAPGLYFDARHIKISPNEPVFKPARNPDIFRRVIPNRIKSR